MPPIILRQPRLAVAAILVLTFLVAGATLWSATPWRGSSPQLSDASPERSAVQGVKAVSGPPSRPAPSILETIWKVDKSQIEPGEQITLTLVLKNVWSHRIEITDFPAAAMLNRVGTENEEPVPVQMTRIDGATVILDPGDELTAFARVSSELSADLKPGGYYLRMDVSFVTESEDSERREAGMGFGSGTLFVITPPGRVLDTTMTLRQVREDVGFHLVLDSIHFSPALSTAVVLAPSSAGPSDVIGARPAPAPTRTFQPLGTPTPLAAPYPAAVDALDLTARFSLDGGPWQELRSRRPVSTPDGVRYRWTFGPVSANAETLTLAVTSVAQAGSEDALLWEWTVPFRK